MSLLLLVQKQKSYVLHVQGRKRRVLWLEYSEQGLSKRPDYECFRSWQGIWVYSNNDQKPQRVLSKGVTGSEFCFKALHLAAL